MDTKGAGLVLVLLFLTLFGAFPTVQVVDHHTSVQHNEPASATVVGTDILVREDDDGDRDYHPVVEYEYTVDGQTYQDDNVYPGRFDRWDGTRSDVEAVIDQYQPGSDTRADGEEVTVHYNPDAPGEAYLRNDGMPGSWLIGIGYVLVAVAGGGFLVWQGFKRWRQRTLMEDTPTETARSLSIGPSEIKGDAVTEDRSPVPAPFTNEPCIVGKYEIKEYDEDDDDSGGSWKTKASGVRHTPFYVDDGTGSVLVRPHDDATYDLEPEDWTETYVDSSRKGPEPIREFVRNSDEVGFPRNASGKDNDRKYRQNLIRPEESVYVFGTVQPRDQSEVATAADNADRLVVEKVEDRSMRELMFMISDDEEEDLVNRRRWALWRLPVGGVFVVGAFVVALFIVGPVLGLEMPKYFAGLVKGIS